MVTTATDLKEEGIDTPILVGGAALSKRFVDSKMTPCYKGMVLYAQDAMDGLSLAQKLVDPVLSEQLIEKEKVKDDRDVRAEIVESPLKIIYDLRSTLVKVVENAPVPPYFERHLFDSTSIDEIWLYVNNQMLFGRHLGFRGNFDKALERGDSKAVNLMRQMTEVKAQVRKVFQPKAVYQFFQAKSWKNDIILCDESQNEIMRFTFKRQRQKDGLCLSDLVNPPVGHNGCKSVSWEGNCRDNICMFVVSMGRDVISFSKELKDRGEFLKSHMVQALALEMAEGYAELLHRSIRNFWGLMDHPDLSKKERFQAKYQGRRYSFGFPACPDLEDNQKLFSLLKPEDIGCCLTEGFMMDPEASVSAMVFHHPDATYFSV